MNRLDRVEKLIDWALCEKLKFNHTYKSKFILENETHGILWEFKIHTDYKKYKSRHDWVEKIILWELCKKLKFDHSTKLYNFEPESVLQN